jgi:hypothetical protein
LTRHEDDVVAATPTTLTLLQELLAMSTAREIASQVFPHFAQAVLARKVRTYGYYAHLIGRDVAKQSITIGPAMHLIGAICVMQELPVAPLHYVERKDGEARRIFAADEAEAIHVLPHLDTLYVASCEYCYSAPELERLGLILQWMLEKAPPDWSPHQMWRFVVSEHPDDSNETYFQLALRRYEGILDDLRAQRQGRKRY